MIIKPNDPRLGDSDIVTEFKDVTWDDRRNLTEQSADDIIELKCSKCEHTWASTVTLIRVDGDYIFVEEEELKDEHGRVLHVKTSEVFCPECSSLDIEREGLSQLEEYREKLRENWKLHQLADLETSQSRQEQFPEKPYHKGFQINETRITPLERITRRRQGWTGVQPAKRSGYHHWICMKLGIHLNIRPTEHPWAIWRSPKLALEQLTNALAEGNDWLEVKLVTQDILVPGPKGWIEWATRERLEFLVSADVLQDEELAELSTFMRLSYGKARMMAQHNPPFFSWRDFVEFLESEGTPEPTPQEICESVTRAEHQKANMPEQMSFKFVLFPEGNQFGPRQDIPDTPTCIQIVQDRIQEIEHECKLEETINIPKDRLTRAPKWIEQVRRPFKTNLRMARSITKEEVKDD